MQMDINVALQNPLTRIVYVVFGESGGMFHYAQQLSEAATENADASLVVYAGTEGPAGVERRSPAGISRRILERVTGALQKYSPGQYWALADRLVDEAKPDIVHITSPSVGLHPLVHRLNQRGVDIVYTVHDPVPHDEGRTTWGKIHGTYHMRYELPGVLSGCSAIHVHSPKHRDQIRGLYGQTLADKVYAVQHGAGLPPAIAGGTRIPFELESLVRDLPTFLFFGRIERYKGLDILFEALRFLEQTGTAVNVVVAGNGMMPSPPADLEDVRLICINRFIADEEVRALFEACDVVLLPYTDATQSGVVPMAYAFGKPVIASQVGALDEIVVGGTTGLLVPPSAPETLARAMRVLAGDTERIASLAQGAQEYMDTHLSWRAIARVHQQKYREILDQ